MIKKKKEMKMMQTLTPCEADRLLPPANPYLLKVIIMMDDVGDFL